jgi:hypothetical protein
MLISYFLFDKNETIDHSLDCAHNYAGVRAYDALA